MLTIYGVYRSRASRNYWLAGELGIPFKSEPIIQTYRLADPNAKDAPPHTRTAAFLQVNPNGHIPSMDDDGLRLHELLAINLYIAKKHGGALAPANLAEDALMTMWSLWAANELETSALQILTHRAGKVELRDPKLAQAAIDALRAPFGVLDKALADTGFLVGGRFTVADINVAEVVRYAMAAPELFSDAPRVKAWLEACHARPAFKAMMAEREQEPA